MQSNGGVTSPQVATRTAASTLLSGPAAGPIAGLAYISIHGYDDCITVDMGGTSFDAALVKDRTPLTTTEAKVNRYQLALPTLWIHTIGAGGGSIGWVDEGGLLRMGPQSAGADPGPACYGLGGEKPACTDADLFLGYLNKDYFLGGKMPLNYERAKEAIQRYIATPLGLDIVEAAAGMYQVINVSMAAGVKEVSVQRGFDPRDFPLIVAGGAGPVHAGPIALELEIPLIIVPKESSIFCAAGMLMSDLKHDFVRSYTTDVAKVDRQKFQALFAEMEEEGKRVLALENIPRERMQFIYSCDLRYLGQYYEVNVTLAKQEVEDGDFGSIMEKFHHKHDQLYGYHLKDEGMPAELINLRTTAIGVTEKPQFKEEDYAGEDSSRSIKGHRPVYLPQQRRFEDSPVYDGTTLCFGNKIAGPAIIEQPNTSIFVLPEFSVICDRYGSYTMYLKTREKELAERLMK
ncbi:MAG: hydantoinase/oxoprolinase family protein, partial [Dehalococcoidia bacterium]|nr:hydantoinase/oxoprolinase family protein [Dehalococcoidia bacterium]